MADTKQHVQGAEEKMNFAIEYLDEQLSHIRAGKANPRLLDSIKVPYYGAPTPLNNVASVTIPDARTIMITPWEKKIIRDIEKAILDSDLGITPDNNGEVIRLVMPPLTEERVAPWSNSRNRNPKMQKSVFAMLAVTRLMR